MGFIRKGFCDIYSTSHTSSTRNLSHDTRWQVCLSNEERDSLSQRVTTKEIEARLWLLKANKASRPNVLHASFFQYFWPMVGESVIKEVKSIFYTKTMPKYLNT